jgi:hypothetical protein
MYLFNFVETMDPDLVLNNPSYPDTDHHASENPLSSHSIHNYIVDIYRTQVLSCHNPGGFLFKFTVTPPFVARYYSLPVT